jgi:hypothetical protein
MKIYGSNRFFLGNKMVTRYVRDNVNQLEEIPAAILSSGDECFIVSTEETYFYKDGAWVLDQSSTSSGTDIRIVSEDDLEQVDSGLLFLTD